MPSYSNELRDAVLRRVLPPQNDSISKVAAEEGISGQTIRNWINKAREAVSTAADVSTQHEKWSSQDKFCIVVETAGMTDTELAEYADKKGLCADEISAWREACMNANAGSASETARLQRENRELERKLRSTERELVRKEKVLAEVAALLVLGKKAGAVWGGPGGRMLSAPDCEEPFQLMNGTVPVKRNTSWQDPHPGVEIGQAPEGGDPAGSMPW